MVWWVAFLLGIVLLVAIGLATWVAGDERALSGTTVVLLDLSASTVPEEFSRSRRAQMR